MNGDDLQSVEQRITSIEETLRSLDQRFAKIEKFMMSSERGVIEALRMRASDLRAAMDTITDLIGKIDPERHRR